MSKLFIFDIGGVILQNFDITKDLSNYLNQDLISIYSSAAMQDHYRGLITEEEFWTLYKKEANIDLNPKEELLRMFFSPTIDKDSINIIKSLKSKGYRVVAGSNIMDAHYQVGKEMNLFSYFDEVYASHLMHIKKPEEEFFTYILEKENINPKDVYFIDDLEENIMGAKNMGINTILFTSADKLLHDLKQFF